MSSSSAQKVLSTPTKAAAATPAATESPGTWRHPRLVEITRRQNATTFTEKDARRVACNVALLATVIFLHGMATLLLPPAPLRIRSWLAYLYTILRLIPVFNIIIGLLPLFRPKDDLSDIPLTPGQRKLLGLPPSSAPPTPGSVYSTPPRYPRSPSVTGSSGRRSFSGSPMLNGSSSSIYGTPLKDESVFGLSGGNPGSSGSVFSSVDSPLIHKAVSGARRASVSSMGSSSPLRRGSFGASTSSLFGGVDSPSPATGKRSSVGLNSRWLYEKGRRTSGNLLRT